MVPQTGWAAHDARHFKTAVEKWVLEVEIFELSPKERKKDAKWKSKNKTKQKMIKYLKVFYVLCFVCAKFLVKRLYNWDLISYEKRL